MSEFDLGLRPTRGAYLSADGMYRYTLWRHWNTELPLLGWVMLNPSTADADVDDRTIRQCCKYARRDGYGGIVVVNLFAYRTTWPAELRRAGAVIDVVGPGNPGALHDFAVDTERIADVVVAWGGIGRWAEYRTRLVTALLRECRDELWCLGVTQHGHPRHPSRLADAAPLVPWA